MNWILETVVMVCVVEFIILACIIFLIFKLWLKRFKEMINEKINSEISAVMEEIYKGTLNLCNSQNRENLNRLKILMDYLKVDFYLEAERPAQLVIKKVKK